VEWPERAAEALGEPDLEAELEYAGRGRRLHLRAGTPAGRNWLEQLARQAGA
jgi:tRNA A37 threonylcarbamoyladenosine biosynthesis protein TsaE